MPSAAKQASGTAVADPIGDRFLARQPIFSRQGALLGYELLFRSGIDNFFKPPDASIPPDYMIDSFLMFGLDTLSGGRRAFINFTREDLIRELPTLFPADRIVIEILEGTSPDPEVVSACRKLKQAGYTIALDDYSLNQQSRDLLPFADIVKVDFINTPAYEREMLTGRLASAGVKLLAERVETQASVSIAREMGYSYFQGFFYCEPQIVSTFDLKGFKPNYLRMLLAVSRPQMNLREVEGILKQEPSLLLKLLRYLNSAYFCLRSEIKSLRHAIALLGEEKLRKWASVAAMVHLASDRPSELIVTSLVRAHFCESLALPLGMKSKETDLFLLGLLSAMDAILGRDMPEVVREIPVPEVVATALLGQPSRLEQVLALVLAFERGAWSQVQACAVRLRLDEPVLPDAYLRAVEWAAKIHRA